MRPQTSQHTAHRFPAETPRAAAMTAISPASSFLFFFVPALLVVSLGLSLAIILPR